MRVQILNPIADGPTQDWDLRGTATAAYSALAKDSGTSGYIASATALALTSFEHGNGAAPELGFVSQVSLHYVIHPTGAGGTADLSVGLFRNGSVLDSTSHTVSVDDVIYSSIRMPIDAITSTRFTAPDLEDLESRFEVQSVMTGGEWRIYAAWIEVEWVPKPEFYDPVYHGVTPDAITGDMTWSTTGAQGVSIGASQLQITDTSTVDWREYTRSLVSTYNEKYTTYLSTRFNLASAMSGPTFVYRMARLEDGAKDTDLCAFIDSAGDKYIGISSGVLDRDDPSAYKATYQIDWTEDHHYLLVVDRSSSPGPSKDVKVYVDHDETPVMDVLYSDMETGASTQISFGTGNAGHTTSQVTVNLDYFDWWTQKTRGESFYGWWDTDETNNTISINSTDTYIATKQIINPPGIEVGQSNYCCEMVLGNLSELASIRTYWPVADSAGTYDLTLDYRMDSSGGDIVTIQRTSDYYYWNNVTSTWQDTVAYITVPNSVTRTRSTVASNIQTTTPDNLMITIRTNFARTALHTSYIYRVHLAD